ncbi:MULTISPECIES: DUF3618 domain-containing protein [unclassified Actinobaculum]|uniref:DUF3618 domain-containing protein n=1 Tax=unclassified Actinobaculum TaxID=2609299 RepID=UPI0013DE011E|nr:MULTISPECIES: DUF3618 domain-containing protein [unclassified Actinobaculum]
MSDAKNSPDSNQRSIAQIEAELRRTREEMTQTVNELAGRLDPKVVAKAATDQAKKKAATATTRVKALVHDAKSGDLRAIGILAGSVVVVVGLGVLVICRH